MRHSISIACYILQQDECLQLVGRQRNHELWYSRKHCKNPVNLSMYNELFGFSLIFTREGMRETQEKVDNFNLNLSSNSRDGTRGTHISKVSNNKEWSIKR